ncbi:MULTISPECIES: F0F1 ATP synthase subunit gamma [Eikenella]|jgi:ATP synthase F1, gamma subunit|uniref:ATP synthase gamma chain n=3 Tax=Eikenella corrodens TaxID=539 RepID=V7IAQ1_EIKCO|nr:MULTISPECIES: F0F1 ATP synthase subunit gamma [Eikenella]EEG23833.1 ATP synthase F1, gamma subunit [Eikenella corrodens ATCC 23834]ETA82948.1 ATP synthase gamma chain [Eikenella corrodens CC92I]MDU1346824.1 F0F1 ATP synthase subunit gamma [Eikenella corrodens]MDU4301013.1 F0F1 ATP synthase subunit gamma [Eikenella corrodens]OAM16105.1 F0F1 ATP synthase subunit gamma [Eikenella corrodens]
MAVGKEILTKIRSVQNTQKITKAMQMVSTSKMRKTQDRMRLARPYAEKVRIVMSHLAQVETEHKQLPILESRENIRRAGFILITTDKGLCGGLNANLLKKFLGQVQEYQQQGVEVEVICFGSKGLAACNRAGLNVVASAVNLGDTPKMEVLLGSLTEVFQRYADGGLDIVHLVYSRFINTMRQEPNLETLLPIGHNVLNEISEAEEYGREYVYEPSPILVLEYLVRRYLESVVYQALCENMASEQSARMVAMKAATDNASNAIKELRLIYNKSRQAAITTELSEIVAGAAAV